MKKKREFTEIVVPEYEKMSDLFKSILCGGMDRHEVQFIAPYFKSYHVDAGIKIYEEGDLEAFLCLIVQGSVNVVKGENKVISSLGAGETVGEMTIIDEMPRSASAYAASETIVYAITRRNLNEIFDKSHLTWSKLFFNISKSLSLRLRQTSDTLSHLLVSSDISQHHISSVSSRTHSFLRKVNDQDSTI